MFLVDNIWIGYIFVFFPISDLSAVFRLFTCNVIISFLGHCFIVLSLSCVQLLATSWTTACQVSLSFTMSLLKLRPIESVIYWNISSSFTPFSSFPQFFPALGSFPISWLFTSGGRSIGASASVSVLPINIQDWFPLGLTDLISL